MSEHLVRAVTLIRAAWPNTTSWWEEPTVRAWGVALADLTPAQLERGVTEAMRSVEWPSIAAIRRAALADELAPPLAVALEDHSHPVAQAVALRSMVPDTWPNAPEIDPDRFARLYPKLAEEWNRRRLGGETWDISTPELRQPPSLGALPAAESAA